MNYKNVLKSKLRNQFKYNDFKDFYQQRATEKVYEGTDVYINMPTGYGKSLCFQLPVVAKENSFAIVISPTITHAKDQIDYLKSKNILAYCWNAHTPKKMRHFIKNQMTSNSPKMKLLYITPEQCLTLHFQILLRKIKPNILSYFVIDEAHCLSQWAHDFRRAYRKLTELRNRCPKIAIVAVTSTATKEVEKDIIETLRMKPAFFQMPVFRPNLYYDALCIDNMESPLLDLIKFIQKSLGNSRRNCGIIFCETQEDCINLSQQLTINGIRTSYLHTRLKMQKRLEIQRSWNAGEFQVIAATSSFGVGTHKQSVRFVVHGYVPVSIESYYQESGRAGHDDKISYCRIYYSIKELNGFNVPKTLNNEHIAHLHITKAILPSSEKLRKFLISSNKCRHAMFSQHFEDVKVIPLCNNHCDVCKNKTNEQNNNVKTGLPQLECSKSSKQEDLREPIDCDKSLQTTSRNHLKINQPKSSDFDEPDVIFENEFQARKNKNQFEARKDKKVPKNETAKLQRQTSTTNFQSRSDMPSKLQLQQIKKLIEKRSRSNDNLDIDSRKKAKIEKIEQLNINNKEKVKVKHNSSEDIICLDSGDSSDESIIIIDD